MLLSNAFESKHEDTGYYYYSKNSKNTKEVKQNKQNKQNNIIQSSLSCTSCTHSNTGDELYPLLDPKFNFRDVAGQLLLLEGHLSSKRTRCIDCVRKHAMTAEHLVREALTMSSDPEIHTKGEILLSQILDIEHELAENNMSSELAQRIRKIRKPLVQSTFNQPELFKCGQNDNQDTPPACSLSD